jgi:hypothetical protein
MLQQCCWTLAHSSCCCFAACLLPLLLRPSVLQLAGMVVLCIALYTSPRSWQREEADESGQGGLDALRPDAYVVNGMVTQHNPWAASANDVMWKYRERMAAKKREEADSSSSGSSSR